MAALREYLAAQAELGTDEVLLPQPLQLRLASEKTKVKGTSQEAPQAAPAPGAEMPQKTKAEGFLLQMLNDSLRKDGVQAPLSTPAAAKPVDVVVLPEFASLDAYWTQVEKNLAALHGAEARGIVKALGPVHAPLALVGMQPSMDDAAAGKAFQGAAGDLLARMMKAIRLDVASLYMTTLVKTGGAKAWSRRELSRLLPWLHAELGLAKAPVVLLLGEACAQTVLKTGKPMEELRQSFHVVEGRSFAVTYHPEDLLHEEDLKRKAWEDLQWLQRKLPLA